MYCKFLVFELYLPIKAVINFSRLAFVKMFLFSSITNSDKEEVLLIYPKAKEQDIKQVLNKVKHTFGSQYT